MFLTLTAVQVFFLYVKYMKQKKTLAKHFRHELHFYFQLCEIRGMLRLQGGSTIFFVR